MQQQGQTLFVLQNELLDKKMEATMGTRLAVFRNEMRDEFRADLDKSVMALREDLYNFKTEMREFKNEMHKFKDEMHKFKDEMREAMREFRQELHQMRHEFGTRLIAVESVLAVIQQRQSEIRTRLLDYSFKAGWIILFAFIGGLSSSLVNYLQTLIK